MSQGMQSGDAEIRAAVGTAISATERGDYRGALRLFRLVLEKTGGELHTSALSSYGLALVMEERRTKLAIELAERALKQEFFDARHWANLVRIYLAGGSRRRAIAILQQGLDRMPNDRILMALREQIGYRRTPPIPFLHRDNLLNVWLGKRGDRGAKVLVLALFLVALVAVAIYFVMIGL